MAGDIPVFKQSEKVQEAPIPNLQNAYEELAESHNLLSNIGAKVAQNASNQMAKEFGYEAGKTPHGNLSPSITEFDKNFAESYSTQAHATLSLQGQKLLDDAAIVLARQPRLTPDLIASTNKQVEQGLNKIAANAPTAVKAQLESTFASQQLQQNSQYQQKMISEQREDQKNVLINSIDLNIRNILELSKNGDVKGAQVLIERTKKDAQSGLANRFLDQKAARVTIETAEQVHINGILINKATQAESEGKLDGFEKDLIDRKIPGTENLTNTQLDEAANSVKREMDFRSGLRKQDESLRLAQFNLAIVDHPDKITAQEILNLKANVTPIEFVNAQIRLVTAKNKISKELKAAQDLAGSISNQDMFASATRKTKDDAFDLNVDGLIQQREKEGHPVDKAQAQLIVAMNAAGTIPKYVNLLQEQLGTSDPYQISLAGESIEQMYKSGNGNKLEGLGDAPFAMYHKFQALSTSMPPIEAAQKAHEIVYGKTEDQRKANDIAWADNKRAKIKAKESDEHFYLTQAGISPDALIRNRNAYARQMENVYESYFKLLNGDDITAKKMLQKTVALTYGETHINGKKEFTYLPIEKILNLPDNAIGIIQADMADQLTQQFKHTKDLYDNNKSDFYWEVRPVLRPEDQKIEIKNKGINQRVMEAEQKETFNSPKSGVEVVRHWRGQAPERYETILQANPYSTITNNPANPVAGGWEIMLKSDQGVKSIGLLDSVSGVMIYRPDGTKIKDIYSKLYLSDELKPETLNKLVEKHPFLASTAKHALSAAGYVIKGAKHIREKKEELIKSTFSGNK